MGFSSPFRRQVGHGQPDVEPGRTVAQLGVDFRRRCRPGSWAGSVRRCDGRSRNKAGNPSRCRRPRRLALPPESQAGRRQAAAQQQWGRAPPSSRNRAAKSAPRKGPGRRGLRRRRLRPGGRGLRRPGKNPGGWSARRKIVAPAAGIRYRSGHRRRRFEPPVHPGGEGRPAGRSSMPLMAVPPAGEAADPGHPAGLEGDRSVEGGAVGGGTAQRPARGGARRRGGRRRSVAATTPGGCPGGRRGASRSGPATNSARPRRACLRGRLRRVARLPAGARQKGSKRAGTWEKGDAGGGFGGPGGDAPGGGCGWADRAAGASPAGQRRPASAERGAATAAAKVRVGPPSLAAGKGRGAGRRRRAQHGSGGPRVVAAAALLPQALAEGEAVGPPRWRCRWRRECRCPARAMP